MFDWNDVRHFLAVARTGSTLAAAKELGVNQTTCARRIEALEAAVGQRLFDRTRTGRALTEAGRNLLPAAEAVEKAALEFGHTAASHERGLKGTLRVTTSEVLANTWLTPGLVEFRKHYPDIAIELVASDRILDLVKGEADISVRALTAPPQDPGCVARKLVTVPWAIYCSQGYAERHGQPQGFEGLNDHIVVGGVDDLEWMPGLRWMREIAPKAVVQSRSNSLTNLFHAVKAGLGISPLPVTLGDPEPALIRCSDPIPTLEAGVWLVVPETLRQVPRVRAFMDFVVPYMAATRRSYGLEAP